MVFVYSIFFLGSLVVFIAIAASKKIGTLIYSKNFILFSEVALCLYKSTMCICMEYCYIPCKYTYCTQLSVVMAGLVLLVAVWMLDKLQKQLCTSVSLIFYFLIFMVGPLVLLIDCLIFLSPFLDVIRISMLTFSFLTQLVSGIICL